MTFDISMYEEDADEADAIWAMWWDNISMEEMVIVPLTEEELARAARFDREENG